MNVHFAHALDFCRWTSIGRFCSNIAELFTRETPTLEVQITATNPKSLLKQWAGRVSNGGACSRAPVSRQVLQKAGPGPVVGAAIMQQCQQHLPWLATMLRQLRLLRGSACGTSARAWLQQSARQLPCPRCPRRAECQHWTVQAMEQQQDLPEM